TGNRQNCIGGRAAILLNATSYLNGNIVAFRGKIELAGNGFILNSCMSAIGFQQNGNRGSVYRCNPDTSTSNSNFGLVE
ncbi:MAG: hypothetical protein WBC91_17500, partial [Phototrophicaceae bacterium]